MGHMFKKIQKIIILAKVVKSGVMSNMRKFDYTDTHMQEDDKKEELKIKESTELPFFTTEVPLSTKKTTDGKTTNIIHSWPEVETPWIRVKSVECLNSEDLDALYSLNIQDGTEQTSVKKQGFFYVLRRVSRIVARSVFSTLQKLKLGIEKIVGYLTTTGGNTYIISKIEKGAWSFDTSLNNGYASQISIEDLDEGQKDRLFELVTDNFSALHSKKLLFRKFSLNNVILTNNNICFTDARELRAARKPSLLVEEFIGVVRYLIEQGMGRGSAYHAIATYAHTATDATERWYKEKKRKTPRDVLEVAAELEKGIY